MFLFTTPTPAQTAPTEAKPAPVTDAIRGAAERTGVSFDYLVRTAQRESNLDPTAKAATSSATGLFQFLEQTWLGLLRSDGDKLGLKSVSDAVQSGGDGRLTIADPKLKAQALALREDPQIASVMAGVFTAHNKDALMGSLGREPTSGELYIAHFLGAGGAGELVKLAQKSPETPAANLFPEAAAANRPIFYDRSGKAKGASEVYQQLAAGAATAVSADALAPAPPNAGAVGAAPLVADTPGRPLYGLFRTNGEPVAEAVRKTWLALPGRKPSVVEAGDRVAFFPRAREAVESTTVLAALGPASPSAAVATLAPPGAPRPVDVPQPPQRPRASARPPAVVRPAQRPLDLLAFTKGKD